MGTVSDKLTYLNTTKVKIKDSINLTGAGITDQDTFRSYETKLKDGFVDIINNGVDTLYENFPKVAQTSEEPTLNGVYEAPMRVDLNGNAEQDSYSGKNLYQVIGTTHNGLTGTLQSDGTLKISGKATHTSSNITTEMSTNLPAGTYTFSITKTVPFRVLLRGDNNANIGVIQPGSTSHTFTTTSVNTTLKVFLYLLEVDTTYDEVIGVQLEAGSPATSFEPFVGGTASPNPDYPQDIRVVKGDNTIKVTGKNLFDKDSVITGYWLLANGTLEVATQYVVSDYISVIPNTNYYLPKTDSRRLKYYDDNKEPLTTSDWDIDSGSNAQVITIPSNAKYVRFTIHQTVVDINTFQFENDTTATSYQPYTSTDYAVNIGNMELCKIGDYKDYIYKENDKWYLKKNIGKVVLDGSEAWATANNQVGTSGFYRYSCNDFQDTSKYLANTPYISDNFKYSSNTLIEQNVIGNTTASNTNRLWITIDTTLTGGTATTDFKNWLSTHNTTVYYVLATPTYEEITATTLIEQLEDLKTAKSVEGQTNITQTNEELPFILDVSGLKKD